MGAGIVLSEKQVNDIILLQNEYEEKTKISCDEKWKRYRDGLLEQTRNLKINEIYRHGKTFS